jgi:hypothetical protein
VSNQAKVRSTDDLEAFRASLIIFINRAKKAIDQASDEIRRTRLWVETDRRLFWETEVKKRTRRLDQVQGELMTARMSAFIDNPTTQQMAVRKAKAHLAEAEEKVLKCKHWSRNFDSTLQPLAKKIESVTQFIDHDMPQAVIHMAKLIRALDDYTDSKLDLASPAPTATEAPPTS